jgi:hypothetical protein
MLRYMSRRVLNESAIEIHEEEIGTRLFGREPDYDKSIDPIVRVQASHLRKRLTQYFESEGASEPIVLEVPKGSYLPVFRYRLQPAVSDPVAPVPVILPLRAGASQRNVAIPALAALSAILALICVWLTFQLKQKATGAQEFPNQPALQALYAHLFSPNARTSLIVADSSFTFVQDALKRPIPLDTYLSRDPDLWMKEARQAEKLDARFDSTLTMLAYRQYTSLADLNVASKIELLLSPVQRSRFSISYARNYSVRAANSENLILLGSERSNPWDQLFSRHLDFTFVSESPDRVTVYDRKPGPGQPASYALPPMSRSGREGYSIFALLPGASRDTRVLIIAGTDMEATESAGILATSESELAPVLKRVWPDTSKPFPYFEMLLKTRRLAGAPQAWPVIVARVINP